MIFVMSCKFMSCFFMSCDFMSGIFSQPVMTSNLCFGAINSFLDIQLSDTVFHLLTTLLLKQLCVAAEYVCAID